MSHVDIMYFYFYLLAIRMVILNKPNRFELSIPKPVKHANMDYTDYSNEHSNRQQTTNKMFHLSNFSFLRSLFGLNKFWTFG